MATVRCEPLSRAEAEHLLSRTTLRYSDQDIAELQGHTLSCYLVSEMSRSTRSTELVELLSFLPHQNLTAKKIYESLLGEERATSIIEDEMQRARLIRGLLSEEQLREVMTDFWFNHFNADPDKGTVVACNVGSLERDLRDNAFGKFRTLLGLAVKNPAVLENLDNSVSQGHAVNENFGRELMELYTTGRVYTQRDVVELSRAFSGWSHNDNPEASDYLEFRFYPALHSRGNREILGRNFEEDEQEMILDMLSSHPATAEFLSRKLLVRFLCDEPDEQLVSRIAQVYLESDGDIATVLQGIFQSREFFDPAVRGAKFKSPLEFIVAAIDASKDRVHAAQDIATNSEWTQMLIGHWNRMGSPYTTPNPLGWPDQRSTWTSGVGLRERRNLARNLSAQREELLSRLLGEEFQSR